MKKSVIVNAMATIKDGSMQGMKGIVIAYDNEYDEVRIQVSEKEQILTCANNIIQ